MNENQLLVVWIIKFLLIGLCAVLYRLGGQYNKAIRRYAMPFVYIAGISALAAWKNTFNWWLLLSYPLLMGSLCIGYGGSNIWQKVRKRGIYGLALALSFLPFAFIYNNWILYAWHCILCIGGVITFGVFNPFGDFAVGEEATIGVIILLMPSMMV